MGLEKKSKRREEIEERQKGSKIEINARRQMEKRQRK